MIDLIDPTDSLERQNEKLLRIASALMHRVEQDTDRSGAAYAQFERAALLEGQVRQRTLDLEHTLALLHDSNAELAIANRETERARRDLADAIEAVNEGFALFSPEGRLVMSNSRFCQPMADVVPALQPGLSFEDYIRRVSRSRFLALPDGETPASWAERRIRHHAEHHVMLNVRLIWDRWLQVSEHRTGNGGTVVLQTDVTDIMRLEREERSKLLDRQAQMIRATLDHMNQGVCIFDSQSRLVGWNQKVGPLLAMPLTRFRLGASFDLLMDRLGTEKGFEADMSAEALRDWAHRPAGRPPLSFEIRQGSHTTLAAFAQEMPDRGFVISFTDVSAERAAARALHEANDLLEQRVLERTLELEDALAAAERANASKSRFVAAASHDLLQPLSAAKLYVSSLAEGDRPAADLAVLAKAESALVSVEQILDALLDISKLESGRAAFDIAAVRLMDILTPLQHELQPLAAQKGLDLRIVPSTAVVDTDASFLRRILQNLIGNAIRYTETGRVLVGARRARGGLRIEVWDTGPGIAEADQDMIFQEFHRLGNRASASEGMGLGLAIVERACARLGHPLGMWSEPGRGTGFFVSLPLSIATGREPRQLPGRSGPRLLQDAGLIVLLVENDLDLRRALSLLMEKWGVSVLDVEDPATALSLLEEIEITPDALLLDYQLGEHGNGLDLLDAIRARYGALPARVISADRSPALQQGCVARGVELLQKPLNTAALERFLIEAAAQVRA
ncbi:MAG: PAS-domain containing protein [Celeribacter sp.]|jgi:signal transduction histidine kinase/ActR/RegA family two-component response regulator